ncbi:hypothetical protein C3L23_02005 [Nautilia sp. PV-1]|uniref:ferritin-like domain-containing protein n=1 Tax=Nautilia sp. PV-1 TaxID=2579250 RepID=UPI000FD9C6AA|nr:DUF2202 domain-containing protein [Nautilia sp. PV-1]AZV46087.1 hypothetical protein C3L23_02005 [Nautilia sp. PV-1]
MKIKILAFLMLAVNLFALTPKEKHALNYMYQEEKLARDVYFELGKMYPDLRVFNIYRSEIMHENSVANVMKHYGLPLPVRGDKVGKFVNPELQKLYDELIAKGKKSLKDALEVGIMVEVTDVNDLNKYLYNAVSPDVIALFKFLRAGSYNHYNAFNRTLISVTGKSACQLMSKEWCKHYPFQRGVGRKYINYYWFAGKGMMRR